MSNLKLVVAIMNFLKEECSRTDMTDDTKESLEVAIQCLQSAYDLKSEDVEAYQSSSTSSLFDIYRRAVRVSSLDKITAEMVATESEKYKTLGNDLMKSERNAEAVVAYTQAISLNGSNAVYFCNRAAAYSRMGDYHAAVKDCEEAVRLDPTYGKAYGRMGLACSSLGDHKKAMECYKKAIELDPSNESYHTNLKLAEENASKVGNNQSQPGSNTFVDMSGMMSNPVLQNIVSNIGQDPNMANIMSNMMSASLNESGNVGTIESLFNEGLRLAQQMQASNPQFVEQLREQLASGVQRTQNDNGDQEAPN